MQRVAGVCKYWLSYHVYNKLKKFIYGLKQSFTNMVFKAKETFGSHIREMKLNNHCLITIFILEITIFLGSDTLRTSRLFMRERN